MNQEYCLVGIGPTTYNETQNERTLFNLAHCFLLVRKDRIHSIISENNLVKL